MHTLYWTERSHDAGAVVIVCHVVISVCKHLKMNAKMDRKTAERTCHAWKVPHLGRSKTPGTSVSSGSCAQNSLVWDRMDENKLPTSGTGGKQRYKMLQTCGNPASKAEWLRNKLRFLAWGRTSDHERLITSILELLVN
jgi:hypothetical protein